jgi:hypothetical protein
MNSCVGESRDARFVRARRDSKAWSCQVEESVRESWERRGRIADVDGKAELKTCEGLILISNRDNACAVLGAALGG